MIEYMGPDGKMVQKSNADHYLSDYGKMVYLSGPSVIAKGWNVKKKRKYKKIIGKYFVHNVYPTDWIRITDKCGGHKHKNWYNWNDNVMSRAGVMSYYLLNKNYHLRDKQWE